MSKIYACGYLRTLKSQVKSDNTEGSYISTSPSEVNISSRNIDELSLISNWSHSFEIFEKKIIAYCSSEDANSSKLITLPYQIKSFSITDTHVFIVDIHGMCLQWKDVEEFIENGFSSPDIITYKPKIEDPQFKRASSSETSIVFLDEDDGIHLMDSKLNIFTKISSLSIKVIVSDIRCGFEHHLFLTSNGVVFSYGLGSRGQLGHGSTDSEEKPKIIEGLHGLKVTSISCGGWHSAALTDIGDVYLWGWNESGQIGCDDGSMVMAEPYLLTLPNDENIKKVSLGRRHSAVLTENHNIWTWGWNQYGQLCLNDRDNRGSPTQVPRFEGKPYKNLSCCVWMTLLEV